MTATDGQDGTLTVLSTLADASSHLQTNMCYLQKISKTEPAGQATALYELKEQLLLPKNALLGPLSSSD